MQMQHVMEGLLLRVHSSTPEAIFATQMAVEGPQQKNTVTSITRPFWKDFGCKNQSVEQFDVYRPVRLVCRRVTCWDDWG